MPGHPEFVPTVVFGGLAELISTGSARRSSRGDNQLCGQTSSVRRNMDVNDTCQQEEVVIHENVTQFDGKPVVDWEPGSEISDPIGTAYRIRMTWDEVDEGSTWADKFDAFLYAVRSDEVTALIVGDWGHVAEGTSSAAVVQALVAARDRLPALAALFIGDIIGEESEISWIIQTDVSPVLNAYPNLTTFRVRGGEGLSLGELRHHRLEALTIETGGLPLRVLNQVLAADLPVLAHLELWLGDSGYGWNGSIRDLDPLLAGNLFPKLRYLGLRDSEIADEIAVMTAQSPLFERLSVLDLSLGTLSDEGADALLASPAVRRLNKLDIHHHYCSEAMVQQLTGGSERDTSLDFVVEGVSLPPQRPLGWDIVVDAGDRQEEEAYDGESYRYVAVGE